MGLLLHHEIDDSVRPQKSASCRCGRERHHDGFIKSLGTDAKHLGQPVKSVKLFGLDGDLQWKQDADGLAITCPAAMPYATAVTFRIE